VIFLEPVVVNLNGAHEEAHCLDGVSGSPFLATFFLVDTG
jgi:hypothetical protein